MSGIFAQSPANRRRYGVAVFVGIVAGIISAFVKWGAEHPFPPRSPIDFFAAACNVDITTRSNLCRMFTCFLKSTARVLT